jgi:hypothetical protein
MVRDDSVTSDQRVRHHGWLIGAIVGGLLGGSGGGVIASAVWEPQPGSERFWRDRDNHDLIGGGILVGAGVGALIGLAVDLARSP